MDRPEYDGHAKLARLLSRIEKALNEVKNSEVSYVGFHKYVSKAWDEYANEEQD
jgi:hypothetical protein